MGFRASQHVKPLRWSQPLAAIAEEHAEQMACGEMPFSHKGFHERVLRYPFRPASAAENITYNSSTANAAGEAVQGWLKSPDHRASLLDEEFEQCGIGVARAPSGEFFFSQLFACYSNGSKSYEEWGANNDAELESTFK